MPALPAPARPGFPRRTLLTGSAAAVLVLASGCTSVFSDGDDAARRQADELSAQVPVQEVLVAAYAAARAADPPLGTAVAELAEQAGEQLDRLRAAVPGRAGSAKSGSGKSGSESSGSPAPSPGPDVRGWLREQVAAAASSHAAACVAATGARAALLGSVAAGLRGQERGLSGG